MTQVTGILTDEVGTVLANTTCAVVAIDQVVGQDGGGRVSRGSIVVTDGAGEFDADIKPGQYELVVEAPSPADANVKFRRAGRLTVLTTGPMTLEEALDASFGPINPSILQQAIEARDAAEAFRNQSQGFSNKAQQWAQNPEDAPVETDPSKFSALHWAAKSAQSAIDAAASSGIPSITGKNGYVLSVSQDGTTVEWAPPQMGAAESLVLSM